MLRRCVGLCLVFIISVVISVECAAGVFLGGLNLICVFGRLDIGSEVPVAFIHPPSMCHFISPRLGQNAEAGSLLLLKVPLNQFRAYAQPLSGSGIEGSWMVTRLCAAGESDQRPHRFGLLSIMTGAVL